MTVRAHVWPLGVLLLTTLAVVLTGCSGISTDVTVDFYRGERWQAVLEFTIPTGASNETEIEWQLNEFVANTAAYGVRASWSQVQVEGTQIYLVEMEGTGLDALSQTIFKGEAEIYADLGSGKQLIHFSQYVSPESEFDSLTITLRGGEILDGNGWLVDSRTMTWQNPNGWVEAILAEYSNLSLADAEITVDFFHDASWRAEMQLTIPVAALTWTVGADGVETELDEIVTEVSTYGVDASWRKNTSTGILIYTVKIEGTELDTLSSTVFNGEAEIYADQSGRRRLISFSQDGSSRWGFSSETLTLRGGEIIEGNGWLVNKDTMTWSSPYGPIRATLTERSPYSLESILDSLTDIVAEAGPVLIAVAGAGIVAGLVLGGVQLWRRGRARVPNLCPQCGFHIPKASCYCPACGFALRTYLCSHCGFQMPEDARYCPGCGHARGGFIRQLFWQRRKRKVSHLPSETAVSEELTSCPLPGKSLSQLDAVQQQPVVPTMATSALSVRRRGLRGSLLEQRADASQRSIPLPSQGGLVLGSGPECHVRLSGPEVSARHVAIRAARTSYFIEHLGGEHGTYVNDQLVQKARRLEDGDVIRIGGTSFTLTSGESS